MSSQTLFAQRFWHRPAPSFPYWLRACICCFFFVVMTYACRKFRLDDALIYARYIKNALDGRGLVYNQGESVNALTSVLDSFLQLSAARLLGGRIILAQMLLGGAFLIVDLLLAEWLVPFAGIILSISCVFYVSVGMETSLFLLLLLLTVLAYEKDKVNLLPTLCILCLLTRFEGGALVLFVAWRLWQKRRFPSAVAYLAPAALIALYLGFNFHFYHHLLPQSATAKFGQGRSGFWGRWPTAFLHTPESVYVPFASASTYLPVLTILAVYASRRPEFSRRNEVLLPFLVLLAAFYILFNIPAYFWYFGPFVYFLTIYAARLLPANRIGFACACVVFLIAARGSRDLLKSYSEDVSMLGYQAAGNWIKEHTAASAKIATVETGSVGWTSDRYLYDLVGLTTPKNALYTSRADFSSWIEEKPDFVVLHPDGRFPWDRVAIHSPEYELLPMRFGSGDIGILHHKTSQPSAEIR